MGGHRRRFLISCALILLNVAAILVGAVLPSVADRTEASRPALKRLHRPRVGPKPTGRPTMGQ